MAVTLEDVAQKAGVSHTTVSLVLQGSKRIGKKTRDRVLSAIKEMNYHPNYNARSLAKGMTNTVAIMAAHYSSFFTLDIISGIEDESGKTEYDLNQYSTRGIKEKEAKQLKSILYGRRADGIIIISFRPEAEILKEYSGANVPMVLIERRVAGLSSVCADNEKGARVAVEHLIKAGRKNIGIIHGPLDNNDCTNAMERYTGFTKALAAHGLDLDKRNSAASWYGFDDGVKACGEMVGRGGKPDAVFCAAGDAVALGFMKEAGRLGIKVPSDIAIIGYDDMLAAAMSSPALTTVRQPIAKMGGEAFSLVMKSIKGELKKPVEMTFEPELIIRETA
jgi:LacI family transcriptional regulator